MHSSFFALYHPFLSCKSDLYTVFLIFEKFAHRFFVLHNTPFCAVNGVLLPVAVN